MRQDDEEEGCINIMHLASTLKEQISEGTRKAAPPNPYTEDLACLPEELLPGLHHAPSELEGLVLGLLDWVRGWCWGSWLWGGGSGLGERLLPACCLSLGSPGQQPGRPLKAQRGHQACPSISSQFHLICCPLNMQAHRSQAAGRLDAPLLSQLDHQLRVLGSRLKSRLATRDDQRNVPADVKCAAWDTLVGAGDAG